MGILKQPTPFTLKKVKNNEELLNAYRYYNKLLAEASTLKSRINNIYSKVLENYNFPELLKDGSEGERITDHGQLYKTTRNTEDYFKEVRSELKKAGLFKEVDKGYCPFLESETKIKRAKANIIDKLSKLVWGIDSKYLSFTVNEREELFEFTKLYIGV